MKEERLGGMVAADEKRFGDRAVDGLLAGVAAGLVMALVLAVAGLLRGEAVATLFHRFAPSEEASALSGFLAHVAVSAIYGLIFALLRRAMPRSWRVGTTSVVAGMAYGVVLLALAQLVLLPGSGSSLLALPPLVLAAGHVVYGLALGWLLAKVEG